MNLNFLAVGQPVRFKDAFDKEQDGVVDEVIEDLAVFVRGEDANLHMVMPEEYVCVHEVH